MRRGISINFFKPVTYKLASRSFCIPAILVTYTIFFIEAFLTPGVFRPPYPSCAKILQAIATLLFVGFEEYKMLRFFYRVYRHRWSGRVHAMLLLTAYWSLFSIGLEALTFFIKSWYGWVLDAYFIYGIYIIIGIYKNHI